jgi:hypothetical protein
VNQRKLIHNSVLMVNCCRSIHLVAKMIIIKYPVNKYFFIKPLQLCQNQWFNLKLRTIL